MHLYLFTAFLVLPTNQNTCSCKSHFNYTALYFICYKHFINFISTVSLEWPVKLSCISFDCGGRPEDRPGGNFFLRWWFGENIQTLHRKKKHQLGFEPETVRQCCYLLQCALLRILCLCQDTLYMYHMCSFLCCFTVILFGECPIILEISACPCLCGNLGKCDVNTDFSCNSAKVPPELCHQCPIKHTYRHVIYSFTCAEIPRITVWWCSKWTHTVCKGERDYR